MVILLCWEQRGSCRERFRAKVLDENAGQIYRLYSCILESCFSVALVAPPCEGSTAMEAAHLNLVPGTFGRLRSPCIGQKMQIALLVCCTDGKAGYQRSVTNAEPGLNKDLD